MAYRLRIDRAGSWFFERVKKQTKGEFYEFDYLYCRLDRGGAVRTQFFWIALRVQRL